MFDLRLQIRNQSQSRCDIYVNCTGNDHFSDDIFLTLLFKNCQSSSDALHSVWVVNMVTVNG